MRLSRLHISRYLWRLSRFGGYLPRISDGGAFERSQRRGTASKRKLIAQASLELLSLELTVIRTTPSSQIHKTEFGNVRCLFCFVKDHIWPHLSVLQESFGSRGILALSILAVFIGQAHHLAANRSAKFLVENVPRTRLKQ